MASNVLLVVFHRQTSSCVQSATLYSCAVCEVRSLLIETLVIESYTDSAV
jgi:hypothetical protein